MYRYSALLPPPSPHSQQSSCPQLLWVVMEASWPNDKTNKHTAPFPCLQDRGHSHSLTALPVTHSLSPAPCSTHFTLGNVSHRRNCRARQNIFIANILHKICWKLAVFLMLMYLSPRELLLVLCALSYFMLEKAQRGCSFPYSRTWNTEAQGEQAVHSDYGINGWQA